MIRMLLSIFATLTLSVFPMFTACYPDDVPFWARNGRIRRAAAIPAAGKRMSR